MPKRPMQLDASNIDNEDDASAASHHNTVTRDSNHSVGEEDYEEFNVEIGDLLERSSVCDLLERSSFDNLPNETTPSTRMSSSTNNISHSEKTLIDIMMMLTHMKKQNSDLIRQVYHITAVVEASKDGKYFANIGDILEDIQLPVCTTEEIDEWEEKLGRDSALCNTMVMNLTTLGGTSVNEVTTNILKKMLGHEVALKFKWEGKGSMNKGPFKTLKLFSITCKAVRRNSATAKATDEEVSNVVKRWVRKACDRNGGRKARALKKGKKNKDTEESGSD